MDQKIVQWVQCDDKVKDYNEKSKSIKEMRDKLGQEIISELDIQNKDKSSMPIFNIPTLQTSISPHVTNSYENYTNTFYKECFSEFLGSEDKANELVTFMKSKRKVEKKYSLKRDVLVNLDD